MGGMFGGGQSASPPPPPPPPPAAIPPTMATDAVRTAGANQLARAAAGAKGGTIKTSGQGDLTKPATAKSELLGG